MLAEVLFYVFFFQKHAQLNAVESEIYFLFLTRPQTPSKLITLTFLVILRPFTPF